jgi:hypothetical protein
LRVVSRLSAPSDSVMRVWLIGTRVAGDYRAVIGCFGSLPLEHAR